MPVSADASQISEQSLVCEAGRLLCARGIHNGFQEARWILQDARRRQGHSRGTSLSTQVDVDVSRCFRALLERRLLGEPLQYVLGSTEFYGLELAVGPGVLIPRPETECLVEIALRCYARRGRICDLCTGSGAIALALAHELPHAPPTVGVDISSEALAYARKNALQLGLSAVFLQGDLFSPFPGSTRFGLVTANPPYVSLPEYQELPAEVSHYEPAEALVSGADGFDLFRRIAAESLERLLPGGALISEIGDTQGAEAVAILRRAGYVDVTLHQDYADRDRVVSAHRVNA